MRRYGVSFSWRRSAGLSAVQGRLSRQIGFPLSRSGRERKLGRMAGGGGTLLLAVLIVVLLRLL